MKLKWMRKKFTFMVIPDADGNRGVVRFRVHGLLLYILSIILLVILIFSSILYIVHWKSTGVNSFLKKQLSGQELQFTQTVTAKDTTIEQLQNKVIELSQQANEIKNKVGEMEKLDAEVKSITGTDTKAKASKTPPTDKNGDPLVQGKGGTLIPVTDEDISTLADQTSSDYMNLSQQMNEMFGSLEDTKKKALESLRLLQITPTIWPVDARYISSGFGYRKDPFTYAPTYHSGVDIAASAGDPVFVTADGTVVSTDYDSMHGNNIIVDHTNGIRTWYMHLSKILVAKGDQLTKGQKIGLVGSTGRSTGAHLHYELKKNGVSVDPTPYLKASRKGD
jgi:murein DD-endopeptidase MepM/ murein hydrolase activator NlpD